jgi:hypothetical protein
LIDIRAAIISLRSKAAVVDVDAVADQGIGRIHDIDALGAVQHAAGDIDSASIGLRDR